MVLRRVSLNADRSRQTGALDPWAHSAPLADNPRQRYLPWSISSSARRLPRPITSRKFDRVGEVWCRRTDRHERVPAAAVVGRLVRVGGTGPLDGTPEAPAAPAAGRLRPRPERRPRHEAPTGWAGTRGGRPQVRRTPAEVICTRRRGARGAGGLRAPAMPADAVGRFRRCVRRRSITAPSVMTAMIRITPPHAGHASGSTS